MKRRIILAAVSALALTAAVPAFAATTYSHSTSNYNNYNPDNVIGNNPDTPGVRPAPATRYDMRQGWESFETGDADHIRVFSLDNNAPAQNVYLTVNENATAKGFINKSIYGMNGDKLGYVKDIILDSNGKATLAVISDGGVLGLGEKLVAYNFDSISGHTANGGLNMPLTKYVFDRTAQFAYEPSDAARNVQVMPQNSYSLSKILDGELLDYTGDTVAEIDNVTFRGSQADNVVVSYNQTLGVGGEQAAIDYGSMMRAYTDDDDIDLQMSEAQSRRFESLRRFQTSSNMP